jgi:hypothetical protein
LLSHVAHLFVPGREQRATFRSLGEENPHSHRRTSQGTALPAATRPTGPGNLSEKLSRIACRENSYYYSFSAHGPANPFGSSLIGHFAVDLKKWETCGTE